MREMLATEQRTIDQAMVLIPETEARLDKLLGELAPHCERVRPGSSVLELGAAQGLLVYALQRAGYDVRGIEPWEPAIETSRKIAQRLGVEIDITPGRAEDLPYEDEEFDLVIALSVMEHVEDCMAAFREAHRVLRPKGGFYFRTTSALDPRQDEIRGFPLFPWYPQPLKRRIMRWAAEKRPSLIGGTTSPAINWFTPWRVRRDLRSAGFREIVERWDLKHDQSFDGWRSSALRIVRSAKPLRFAGEFIKPGSGYLAIK
jgi:SAM-dependent methyltransferase